MQPAHICVPPSRRLGRLRLCAATELVRIRRQTGRQMFMCSHTHTAKGRERDGEKQGVKGKAKVDDSPELAADRRANGQSQSL